MYTPPVTPRKPAPPEVVTLTGHCLEGDAYGGAGDWGEVVTRYPYRKVGVDHLLSKENFRGSLRTLFYINFYVL